MLLLKQDITKKKQVDELISQLEFDSNGNNKEYKVEAIWDNAIYTKESEGHLLKLYYLVL